MKHSLRTIISAPIVILLCMVCASQAIAEIESKRLSKPKSVPDFSLTDTKGKAFAKKDITGRWSLVLLGFTHCPDVCPFTLQNISLVLEELKAHMKPESLPQVVFVSVDPERDKEGLDMYVTHFDPSFKGVTGDPEQLKRLVEGIDGFYRLQKKSKDDKEYNVRHSGNVSILNPMGQLTASVNPPMDPVATARFIATVVRDFKRAQTN